MDESEGINNITSKWKQGLHNGTFRKTMREDYNCECDHVARFQSEDERWFDVWYVPLAIDELSIPHQRRILEEVFDDGKSIGLHMVVPNYHYKPRDIVDKVKKIQDYSAHKEKRKAYQRKRYQDKKDDKEYRDKKRKEAREYYREKHNLKITSEEVIRRNQLKREIGRVLEDDPEVRIAALMLLEEEGTITTEQLKELKKLMNG